MRTFGTPRLGLTLPRAEAYVRRAILNQVIDRWRRDGTWRGSRRSRPRPRAASTRRERRPTRPGRAGARAAPAARRACLVLRYYDDLTVDGIAEGARHQLGRGQAVPERRARQDGDRPRRRRHGRRSARARWGAPHHERSRSCPASLTCGPGCGTASRRTKRSTSRGSSAVPVCDVLRACSPSAAPPASRSPPSLFRSAFPDSARARATVARWSRRRAQGAARGRRHLPGPRSHDVGTRAR